MHSRAVSRVVPLALVAVLAAALTSCATAPARLVVVLPNDYYLQPDTTAQSEIVKRGGGIVVTPPIAAYAVSGDVVAGALGPVVHPMTEYPDRAFTGKADTRYFILDTADGKLETDLDKDSWRKRLTELQVPSDFEILPPLPWQQ